MDKFSKQRLPIDYLGVPLFKGRAKVTYFQSIMAKIKKRVDDWGAKLLSTTGKAVLIKSVLCSIPVHTLAAILVSASVLSSMNSILATFFWSNGGDHRHSWVAWNSICKPYAEGGLGVRSFHMVARALHARLAWKFVEGKSLWARYARQRYGHPTNVRQDGPYYWQGIINILPFVIDNSIWILGKGNISFVRDKWCKHGVIGSTQIADRSYAEVAENNCVIMFCLLIIKPGRI